MKLVLHFDINGTITAVDTTEPGTKEENANMVLSKSYFGKVDKTDWVINDPDHYFDSSPGNISYYDFLKSRTKQYKKFSFTFTKSGNPGESLQEFVPIIIRSTESFLFDSFKNALKKYPNALIVLRTFGLDTDDVIKCIHESENKDRSFINGKFRYPLADQALPMSLDICLESNHSSVMEFRTFDGLCDINNLYLKCFDEDNTKATTTSLALIEDYVHWNSAKRSVEFGKKIQDHPDMIQIFFDDNDCVSIHPDPKTKRIQNSYFVKVNTLFAMNDPLYITKTIDEILQTYYLQINK